LTIRRLSALVRMAGGGKTPASRNELAGRAKTLIRTALHYEWLVLPFRSWVNATFVSVGWDIHALWCSCCRNFFRFRQVLVV
jgi:hypothetical protein